MTTRMRTITLEEHFVTESFLRATGSFGEAAPLQLAQLQPKLLDLGAGRIAAMDEAGVDMQVLSLTTIGIESLRAQTVHAAGRSFAFARGERIETEHSYKYPVDGFQAMARRAGYQPQAVWTDADRLFSVHYLKAGDNRHPPA